MDAAFQLNTDGFMPAANSRTPNSSAARLGSDLRTTFSLASCTEPSNDHSMARAAMLESSSCDMPIPIGIWISGCFPLMSGAALTRSSHVAGPSGILHHVRHVEHLRLERARWREELEQIVPLLSSDLGVGARPEIGEGDVVDGDLDAFGGSPVLGVLVEPHVVGRNEVAPLEDLEGLLGPLDPNRRPQSGGHGDSGRRGHEFTPIHSLPLRHRPTLHVPAGTGSQRGTEPAPPRAAWSKRVQYAEGDLIGARRTRVVPGHRAEVLQTDRVTTRPEPQQRVVVVVQLAGERPRRRIVLSESLHVRLVHPGVRP